MPQEKSLLGRSCFNLTIIVIMSNEISPEQIKGVKISKPTAPVQTKPRLHKPRIPAPPPVTLASSRKAAKNLRPEGIGREEFSKTFWSLNWWFWKRFLILLPFFGLCLSSTLPESVTQILLYIVLGLYGTLSAVSLFKVTFPILGAMGDRVDNICGSGTTLVFLACCLIPLGVGNILLLALLICCLVIPTQKRNKLP